MRIRPARNRRQSFPNPGSLVHASTSGAVAPRWRADGAEISFLAPDGKTMAVPVAMKNSALTPGNPVALVSAGSYDQQVLKANYAVTRTGRFLVNAESADGPAAPITLILDWRP